MAWSYVQPQASINGHFLGVADSTVSFSLKYLKAIPKVDNTLSSTEVCWRNEEANLKPWLMKATCTTSGTHKRNVLFGCSSQYNYLQLIVLEIT